MKKYKMMMALPILILAISLFEIGSNIKTTGSIMERDIELTGGLSITLQTNESIDISKLESMLPGSTVRVASGYGSNLIMIQTRELDEKKVMGNLSEINYDRNSIEIGRVEPSIGEVFWQQAQTALLVAFILMGIVVLVMFRSIVPSTMMISCVIIDIIMTIATISILEIKLSMAVFASLLLLIGYSIDTDMLLTTRVLRGQGPLNDRIKSSIKTGVTMTLTGLAAVFCMYIFSQGTILHEMSIVLMIGLCFDMLNTWITNVGLLRMWIEKKGHIKDD